MYSELRAHYLLSFIIHIRPPVIQGLSAVHLTPLEILHTINHCQLQTSYTFTKEEWLAGQVGKHLTDKDFDFPVVVSYILAIIYQLTLIPKSVFPALILKMFEQNKFDFLSQFLQAHNNQLVN